MNLTARFELPLRDFGLDVELDAAPGITVLFGPSGAGKSRVLACIAGLVRPRAGLVALGSEVWFDTVSGANTPTHRRGVGLVFQGAALFPHMTALENVAYGAPGETKSTRRALAREMLTRMRVGHLEDRVP